MITGSKLTLLQGRGLRGSTFRVTGVRSFGIGELQFEMPSTGVRGLGLEAFAGRA